MKLRLGTIIVTLFVVANVAFIFFQIYKYSCFVRLSYTKQRLEKQHAALLKERGELEEKLHKQKDRKFVRAYAKDALGMQPIRLEQVQRIKES